MSDRDRGFVLTSAMQRVPIALIAIGAIAFVAGLFLAPERTWVNLLIDGFFVLSLGVSCLFFFGSQRLANSRWSVPLRRIPEAYTMVLPVAAVLMAVVVGGGRTFLYAWTDPAKIVDPHALVHAGRETWLNPTFTYVRMAGVLAIWIFFAFRLRKMSTNADKSKEAGRAAHKRMNRFAGVVTVIFAFTFTIAAYDWLISLNPTWFSTMYSVFAFAGCNVEGLAAITLAVVVLKRKKLFGPQGDLINDDLLGTLGTMMLAFSTFWAYTWVCQYLLIWYGDIPEEVTYYLQRSSAPWLPIFLAGFVISWIIPFFTLLPRNNKRSLKVMAAMSILILLGRWLDLYIMIMPSKFDAPRFGPLEIAMAAGIAGAIYLIFIRSLARAAIIPTHDPVLALRTAHSHGHDSHHGSHHDSGHAHAPGGPS
jgi:hypothetical protein